MDYAEYEVTIAPAWVRMLWGRRYHYVNGVIKDAWAAAARHAVKARFPKLAPADALVHLVRDYVLDPPYNETEATTRGRIARAWETWQRAGTRSGMLAALNVAGYPNAVIKEHADWSHTGRWWDFWIILRPPFPWDRASISIVKWGRGWRWGDGTRFSTGFPKGEPERIAALVRKWKPSHAHCVNIIVVLDGKLWGDGWRWGDGSRYGGTVAMWRV